MFQDLICQTASAEKKKILIIEIHVCSEDKVCSKDEDGASRRISLYSFRNC